MDPAPPNDKRNIFPFFRLPRELRDGIYECVEARTESSNVPITSSLCCHLRLEGGLCTNLLLVSKQFAAEYKERGSARIKLTTCEFISRSGQKRADIPPVVKNVHATSLKLEAYGDVLIAHLKGSTNFVREYITEIGTTTTTI
ncbi:hypothetical protein CLAFUW4_08811 [Fulvia fulva]|uniref:Uncharacterized protein n=1 Tax=Passalora fulva TaxID=5499 RepID=A0A9Q8PGD0_PASFU|nr:uncharacterized protein CLAFUR5_08918 [Fulvia fulva]KAK4614067.1 hypothetical protein CLAFUR4_08817 [Fulvia fulva]KAK4615103.1 hypothetical protein CLAFUR0_08809 [Fulvia fulva]UJO22109.1 hypothetical protein CLAFUR5_08918 [Fulvia fulva]WPV20499.1 hypothetical protein CLAFUW4_08811 [Fulvia fulva]WPV35346.1 hypothetical protein CLAFUW7_08812 [Fulvia fulva]